MSSRPAPPRPPLGGSWLASQGRLPLAFMALGLGWFLASAVASFVAAEQLSYPHLVPAVVAITHMWVLGFFVTVAVGAIYQLAPVALSTTLVSERSGWWHLGLHGTAMPFMIYGFWRWRLDVLAAAAAVIAAGILLFAVNTWRTVWKSGKRDAVAWSIALGTGWLLLTVLAGLLLVGNRAWGWWAVDPLSLLRAHAHMGLVGFFVTLLQGVTFRLVPMFTLGDVPDWRPVRWGLWLTQVGLLVLAPALAWRANLLAAGSGLLLLAGLGASGWALRQTFATRKKRLLDTGVRGLVRGSIVLVLIAVAGIWLIWPTTPGSSAPGGLSGLFYGMAIILGAMLPAIAGMMGKIVPFLTWMRAYGPVVGRRPTPPATALSHAPTEAWALRLQGAAVLPLLAGSWFSSVPLLRVGTGVLLLGTLLFTMNVLIVFRHLWQPVQAPAAPLAKIAPSS